MNAVSLLPILLIDMHPFRMNVFRFKYAEGALTDRLSVQIETEFAFMIAPGLEVLHRSNFLVTAISEYVAVLYLHCSSNSRSWQQCHRDREEAYTSNREFFLSIL